MKNAIAFAIVLSLLTACTTVEFVRKDLSPQKQGILRYAPTSSEKREAEYREKIKKAATDFCGGDFDITKEYQAREYTGHSSGVGVGTGFGVGVGGIAIGTGQQSTAMYNFIEFTCKKTTP
jgi:hypothetical protein